MPTLIAAPTRTEVAGNEPKLIDVYIGRVNSGHTQLSIAHVRSPGGWVEPGQTPEIVELTVVLKGLLHIAHHGGTLEICAGRAVVTEPGECDTARPNRKEPSPSPFCLPAFSTSAVHRD